MMLARFLERLSLWIEKVAAIFLAAITLIVVTSAVGRYGFAQSIPDAFDISRLLLGATIMWGFASLGFRGSHIKVDLFAEIMPERGRRLVDITAWLVLLAFTVALVIMMFVRLKGAYFSGEATFDLRLPLWPFFALIWAGAAVSLVTISARIVMLVQGTGGLDSFEEFDLAGPAGTDDKR
jgi:TRAP-type C4-dicarboxylate transport system permease small subunit